MHCCHFCNVSFLTLNIVARKLMSAEGLFSFCRAALRGPLELCRWSKCQLYVLTHYILTSISISISIISWFRLINQIPPYWHCISGNNYLTKRALWLDDRGTGNPIQCSEKISFAVSDWTNDFSHTWKTSFALLIGPNLFPNENLRHGFLVSKSQYLYNKNSTSIIRTPLHYGQFTWSERDQIPYKLYLYNTDTSLLRTVHMVRKRPNSIQTLPL